MHNAQVIKMGIKSMRKNNSLKHINHAGSVSISFSIYRHFSFYIDNFIFTLFFTKKIFDISSFFEPKYITP